MTVTSASGPMAGLEVVFHDADGAPVVTARTDSTGRASGDIDDGGMITVLIPGESMQLRATFTGVERDDELTLPSPFADAPELGTAYVTIAPYTGATSYDVRTACGTTSVTSVSMPIELPVDTRCVTADGKLPVMVTAWGTGGMIAVSSVAGAVWTNPMQLTMPGWRPPAVYTVDALRSPADASSVYSNVAQVAGGVRIRGEGRSASVMPGGSATMELPYAPGFGDVFRSEVGVSYGGMAVVGAVSPVGESAIYHQSVVPPARRTVDLSADLLPRVPSPSYDRSVAARPAMTWAAQSGLADTDGAAAVFGWREGDAPVQIWIVLAPGDVGARVQLPALPDELAPWAPTAFATMDVGMVAFVEADWLGSYRALRRQVGLTCVFDGPATLLPATGDATARTSAAGGRL